MKKLLLTALVAAATISASAADLAKAWSTSVDNAWEAGSAVYNAPIAVDASGNTYATGAYKEDLTIAGSELSALGTSAYLAKYDAAGEAKWAVALKGAVSISAISEYNGYVYLAGSFTDALEFGSLDGQTKTLNGMELWFEPTQEYNASFIAAYSTEGNLKAARAFVPSDLEALTAQEMYFSLDGDIFFHITHLQATADGIYASAIYTGQTEIDGTLFEGSYNDPWFGFYFVNLKSAAIIKFDSLIENCKLVAGISIPEPLATEDAQYQAGSVAFTTSGTSTYALFSGNGPLKLATATDSKTLDIEAPTDSYILAEITDGTIGQTAIYTAPTAGFDAAYIPSYVSLADGKFIALGYESYTKDPDSELYSNELFAFTAQASALAEATKATFDATEAEITYYAISEAATVDGSIVFGTLGYYNATGEDYGNGDFSGKVKAYAFDGAEFAAYETAPAAIGIAAAGEYAAFSEIGETGTAYALYKAEGAGVAAITAGENAPAEYFNLQGIRVANPANGLYIKRQGATSTKVLVK